MRKTIFATLVVLLLSSCGIAARSTTSSSLPNNTTTVPSESGTRPKEIINVFPQEQQVTCPTPRIGVGLQLTDAMRTDNAFNRFKHSLKIDGEEVIQEVEVEGTADLPQSSAGISFQPTTPLTLGHHTVSFTFPGHTGGLHTYTWNFEVQNIDCSNP